MRFFAVGLMMFPFAVSANTLTLDDALRATYSACVGIDDEISHLKTMAGINTAVTAVGTATGVGATATGFIKQRKDVEYAEIEKKLNNLIKEQESNNDETITILTNREEYMAQLRKIAEQYEPANNQQISKDKLQENIEKLDELDKESKNLGNWRTGLLAANTATNIAGAAIAGTNKVDKDLEAQIKSCVSAVSELRNVMMQARMDGVDITEAQTIADACDDYEMVDVSKINTRATGAMASSIVGAATGVAGTVVSGVANSDKTRNDNTAAGKKQEKDLNAAANVLSIGATAASTTATIFNATQIAAIKKVATVSEKCTGVLK